MNKSIVNQSIGSLTIGTEAQTLADGVLVVSVSIAENVQYAGYSVYVNGVIVDAYGVISIPSPTQTITRSFRVYQGDTIKVDINTGTSGTATIYGLA
ncbi:MAG: hypothetical protein K6G30_12545 [Acetatifactor sp.]|nr:hypothetical protein [Acetatifactor sp.]